MKYWTICYPGEFGQHVQETFSEEQILKSYYKHWLHKMVEANKHDLISNERCIEDWITIHWAIETNEFGDRIGESIQDLLDREATVGNEQGRIHKRIKELRGNEAPVCWGEDDCSTSILSRCPWRIDCGK